MNDLISPFREALITLDRVGAETIFQQALTGMKPITAIEQVVVPAVPLKKREQGAVPPAPTITVVSVEQRLQADHAGARVLIAEDEPVNQEVVRGLLEEAGLVVDLAEDGRQALELAKRNRYALILMDMQMPHMNGVEATQAIRADSLNRETPILAMTANASGADRDTCLAAGMNEHVSKPVDADKLYETLLTWLERTR